MLALREKVTELLQALPATDPRVLHALGDQLDRDRGLTEVFVGAIRDWLSARLDAEAGEAAEQQRRASEIIMQNPAGLELRRMQMLTELVPSRA